MLSAGSGWKLILAFENTALIPGGNYAVDSIGIIFRSFDVGEFFVPRKIHRVILIQVSYRCLFNDKAS